MALTAGTPNLSTLPSLALSTSRPGTAVAIGYENPSSFIAAFRIAFGCTPGRYFD
jgi:methylphosphotriester-DNA--protein-cysteine methyltransferase